MSSQVLYISSIRNVSIVGLLKVSQEQKSREQKGKQAVGCWLFVRLLLPVLSGGKLISLSFWNQVSSRTNLKHVFQILDRNP